MSDYQFRTTPFPHQESSFLTTRDDTAHGLLFEMGTGKTKVAIDTAAWLYQNGKIDAILVVAPDGVHRNWVTDEIPKHMPLGVLEKTSMFCYRTDKAGTKYHQADAEALLAHKGLVVLTMSYDAVVTDPLYTKDATTGARHCTWRGGKKFLWDFLRTRKVLYVADESRRIKNPLADRTKVVVKSSVYAPYRRLLNGTPVPNGPFDLYSQLLFLDENFWKPHGIGSFAAYKVMFGVFQKAAVRDGNGKLREFNQLLGYKNLDLLQKILSTITSRVTKDQVLNLPPKLYSRGRFELTAAQSRIYAGLRDDLFAKLDDGSIATAPLAITQLLRFQQVTSGFVPTDNQEEPIYEIPGANPRLELLADLCEDIPHGCIIWARFTRSVDNIMALLGDRAVRYDGKVGGDQRAANKEAFQSGAKQFFVSKASTGGDGLTLTKARTVIYYENTYDLAERQQSEDRAHRIGQEHPVNYIDLIGNGTVDEKIVKALLSKFDISQQITGDEIKGWLLEATR